MDTAKKKFDQMATKRQPFIQRARKNSYYTIPQLYPQEGSDANTDFDQPYQSLGAQGVNILSNKIVLTLFPPGTAFFKLDIDEEIKQKAPQSEAEIRQSLYKLERMILHDMETSNLRPKLVDGSKHCIVGGGYVLKVPETGSPSVFSLTDFGITRTRSGEIICLILKEEISYFELEDSILKQLNIDDVDVKDGKKMLELYTHVQRKDKDTFVQYQEINEIKLKGIGEGEYKKNTLPYIYVPFVDKGEDYGRSYVEDYLGDHISLENLQKSVQESTAESARTLYLINPNSSIDARDFQNKPSGSAIAGMANDVTTLQSNKQMDMSIAKTQIEVFRYDLSKIYLMDSAVRRDAERVTAEEIKQVSQELEIALGGIYSTLTSTLQGPLVRLYINRLIKAKKIDEDLEDALNLDVTTGSAALGRGFQYQALTTFIKTLIDSIGPEQTAGIIKIPEYVLRLANSLDIDIDRLIKTETEIMQEAQARQQAQMEQEAMGPMIQAAAQKGQQ